MSDETQVTTFKGSQAKLAQDVQTLLADAQQLLQLAKGEAGAGYKEARERLDRSIINARLQLSILQNSAVESARDAGRNADSYVREHPWETIGIGAAAGFLLGVIIARR